MKFLEKVKNMFTEEVEEDEVKVEKIKKEVKHVPIESPVVNKLSEEVKEENFDFNEVEAKTFNQPVFFDDNDFDDLKISHKVAEEEKKVVQERELYGGKLYEEKKIEEKKAFKPTPIISPVYGVLDKNYHKEDIISRNDYKPPVDSQEPSIDSIRNKAYGTLEDELENTLFGNNSILFKHDEEEKKDNSEIVEVSDDILSDLTDDISKELDELLIKKEKYNDRDTEKTSNDDNFDEDDLLDFIDSTLYKDKEGEEE